MRFALGLFLSILIDAAVAAPLVTGPDIVAGKHSRKYVSVVADILDVLSDDLDPDYHFLILRADNETLYAPIQIANGSNLRKLIGAKAEVSFYCDTNRVTTARRQISCQAHILREDDITILRPPPENPFHATELTEIPIWSAEQLARLGKHRIEGFVLASWRGDEALVKTKDGRFVRLQLADGIPPPSSTAVEAVGYPETDLININLSRALIRPADLAAVPPPETPTNIAARAILFGQPHKPSTLPQFHGRLLRLTGKVLAMPDVGNGTDRLLLDSDGISVPVVTDTFRDILGSLSVGCEISVTGVCVMDTDNLRPHDVFPKIRGFFLVPRSAADVEIVSGPPWWTTPRLLAAIGVLAALIVVLLAVGALLRLRARLRFEERTRLAAELHDYLAQNLTAVDYQLATYDRAKDSAPDLAARCHETARRMLSSCRTELRRCLWDLRNDALEERTFDRAISTSVAPLLADAELHVRFNVPRGHVGDSAAHALLSIIRELVANAIKHGQATRIRIAGEERDALLRFSVTDNGTGFDPADCPDVATGHFGLLGVRERLRKLGGELALASSPGRGTRAVVTVPLRPYGKGTMQS